MKNITLILITISLLFITNVFGQIHPKTLFLVVDQDSLEIKKEPYLKMQYWYGNEKKNWQVLLRHSNVPDRKDNPYKLLIPNLMMEEFRQMGNVRDINPVFEYLDKLDDGDVDDVQDIQNYLRNIMSTYIHEYRHEGKQYKFKKYNVFFVLKSDLSKRFIPCYQISILVELITHTSYRYAIKKNK